jgi:beta-glucanase (GH16 family)
MNTRRLRSAVLFVASFGAGTLVANFAVAAPDKPGYALTFDDEFDGTSLDLTKWQRRYKWGEAVINGELEAYVDDAFSAQNGILDIVGTHQQGQYAGQTLDYTSGVICSVHEQRYGYFEARLKMPKGQGLWPAFWLLGANGTAGVNEIDIHELLGQDPTTVYMTVHWGQSYSVGHMSDGSQFTGPDFSADFHTFGLEWDPDKIVWTIDGVERKRHTGDGVPQVDMYVILNLAIGGGWPGAPDGTTAFPANYSIDYVRAYERLADAGTDASSTGDASAANTGGAETSASGAGGASSSGTGGAGPGNDGSGGVSMSTGTVGGSTNAGAGGTSKGGTSSNGGSAGTVSSSTDGGVKSASSNSSGCGCRTAAVPSDSGVPGTWALAAWALLRRGRKRRSRRRAPTD